MNIQREIADQYQGLFNLMSKEHNLILTISEMDEIIIEAQKVVKLYEIREMTDKVKSFKQFINEDIDNDFKYLYGEDLPKIMDFLKSLGLTTMNYDLDNEMNQYGNPLVRDGLNGIRANYDNRRNRNRLTVWFTNNFESKDNEIRQQVEAFLETLPKHS
jgi:hypothetical protein